MLNLLTLNYWFNLRPPAFLPGANTALISFLGLLLLAAVSFLLLSKKNRVHKIRFRQLYSFSWINLLIGGLLFFFSWQQINFFSARFWYLLWVIVMAVWLTEIRKKIGRLANLREKRKRQREFNKYLP